MMDVSWSATPHPEAFKRPSTAADTLTRLASFIARAESKPGLSRNPRPPTPPHHPHQPHQPQHSASPPCPFSCGDCGQPFSYGTDLLLHQDMQHSQLPKPHQCPHCRQTFSLKSSLQMHSCELFPGHASHGPTYATSLTNIAENPTDTSTFSDVADVDPYACAPCGKGFAQKQALLHHQQAGCGATRSPPRSDDPQIPDAADSPFLASEEDSSSSSSNSSYAQDSICKFCARIFRNEKAFHRHKQMKRCDKTEKDANGGEKKRRKSKRFSCRSCDMVFNCTAKLYHHRKEKHSRGGKFIMEPPPLVHRKHKRPSNRNYTCQICSAVFLHHLSLWAHARKHPTSANVNGQTPIPAKNCTENCKLEKVVTEKKVAPIKITIRKSVWTKDITLDKRPVIKLHKLPRFETTFTTLKPDKVPENEEEEVEEEDVEFPCPSCPEVFSQLSELRSHSELHQTAVSRGKCSVCSCEMDSSKRAGAKRLRLYHCALCQRGFSTLEMFLSHCQDHLKTKVEEEATADA